MREWLLNLPCVLNDSVKIDVRGTYPVAIIGIIATTIESKNDMVNFVIMNLD